MKYLWKKWIFIAQFHFQDQDPDPDSEYGSGMAISIRIRIRNTRSMDAFSLMNSKARKSADQQKIF